MRYSIIMLLSFLLLGCASREKQHFKAAQYFTKNKSDLSNLCVAEFPSETKYIKGETKIQRDTTYISVPYTIDCDSVVNANKDTKKPNLIKGNNKVPFVKETQKVTDTIQKSNSFLEAKLRYQINDLEANNTLLLKTKESNEKQIVLLNKEIKSLEWQRAGFITLIFVLGIIIFKK